MIVCGQWYHSVGREAVSRVSREAHWWVIGARCASGCPGTLPGCPGVFPGCHGEDSCPARWWWWCCSVAKSCPTLCNRASLSLTISWSLLKLMSIESVMPSNRTIDVRLAGTRSMCAGPPALLGKFFSQIFHQMESFQGFPGGPVVRVRLPM